MEGQDASPILYVNGRRRVMPAGKAEVTLLAYLRGARLEHHSVLLLLLLLLLFFFFFFGGRRRGTGGTRRAPRARPFVFAVRGGSCMWGKLCAELSRLEACAARPESVGNASREMR